MYTNNFALKQSTSVPVKYVLINYPSAKGSNLELERKRLIRCFCRKLHILRLLWLQPQPQREKVVYIKVLPYIPTVATELHCKKRLAVFPSPGNNLIIAGQGEFGK